MLRLTRILCVGLMWTGLCAEASGQDSAPTGLGALALSQVQNCQPRAETEGLGTELPPAILDHMERTSRSIFVHAFLLHHIAESGNPRHWLTQCARQFIATDAREVQQLRQSLLGVDVLIRALRTAEEARREREELRAASHRTLASLAAELRLSPSPQAIEAYSPFFSEALAQDCPNDQTTACRMLRSLTQQIDRVQSVFQLREASQDALDRARQAAEEAERQLAAVESAGRQDSVRLTEPGDSAAPEVFRTVPGVEEAAVMRLSLGSKRDSLQANVSSARQALSQADSSHTREVRVLDMRIRELESALAQGRVGLSLSTRLRSPPASHQVTTRIAIADAPPTLLAPQAAAGRSGNLLIELTDFVIDRTKQELVLAFLRDAYSWARSDSLIRTAFPETYALMSSLVAPGPQTKLAIATTARVPLSTWRATISKDFVSLPLNLLQSDPKSVCRSVEVCELRLLRVRPVVGVSRRLMRGEPVLDVLREAPLLAVSVWPTRSPDYRLALRGLTIVAALAEAYQVQGSFEGANPNQHPYVLSALALAHAPLAQQDAFVRVLLVRGFSDDAVRTTTLDAKALADGLTRAARAFDGITAMPQRLDPKTDDGVRVLRYAFAVLSSAGDVAASIADDSISRTVHLMNADWERFLESVEPLITHDYGLAMSRVAVLLHSLSARPVSQRFLTLTGLAASLLEAQDGSQARMAFEAAALPVGGWQAKRYRAGSQWSLSALPGAVFAREWLLNHEDSYTLGPSLPVGLDYQLGRRITESAGSPGCTLGICSAGLFVPLIDLGALASNRLRESDSVEQKPNATLRQVFAPGVLLNLGIGHSPFALIIGGQFMPAIRSAREDGEARNVSAWRLAGGLVADVTLLSF